MVLLLVRHAHAGERSAWDGDDQVRPLSDRGQIQAAALAAALAPFEPKRILSSPATRCIQTIEPLASALTRTVEVEDRLQEATSRATAVTLLDDLRGVDAVLCSHGDIIPDLLDHLVDHGMEPERNLVWQKASVWIVDGVDGGWTTGRYLPPPDRV